MNDTTLLLLIIALYFVGAVIAATLLHRVFNQDAMVCFFIGMMWYCLPVMAVGIIFVYPLYWLAKKCVGEFTGHEKPWY